MLVADSTQLSPSDGLPLAQESYLTKSHIPFSEAVHIQHPVMSQCQYKVLVLLASNGDDSKEPF